MLLMLICIGVAGMHTLGHPRSGHGGAATATSAHGQDAGQQTRGEDGQAVLDPGVVCLAVLTSLLLLLAGMTRLRSRRPAETRAGPALAVRRVARPPPMALLITRVSVLRV